MDNPDKRKPLFSSSAIPPGLQLHQAEGRDPATKPAASGPKPSARRTTAPNGKADGHAEGRQAGKRPQPQSQPQPQPARSKNGWSLRALRPEFGRAARPERRREQVAETRRLRRRDHDFELIDQNDTVLWGLVSFSVDGTEAVPAPLWLTLARRSESGSDDCCNGGDDSKVKHRQGPPSDRGLRLLKILARATRTTLPRPLSPYDLPNLFVGKKLILKIDHQKKAGITELVVKACGPLS